MSDENKTPDAGDADNVVELGPNTSKADLKAAADDFLKNAPKPDPEPPEEAFEMYEDAESETSADEVIAALLAEKEELNNKFLRAHADAENTRRQAKREVDKARAFGIEKFAADLLPVADNLARALEALGADDRDGLSESGKNLLGGIEMTQKELHTALTRHGVTAIPAAPGEAFNPEIHQAVSNIPSEHPNGTIAAEFQPGWKIGDRVLRAAMVAVSAGETN